MRNSESRNLWISVGAGIVAAILLYSYSQEKQDQYTKEFGALKSVVIANEDINELQTIHNSSLKTTDMPTKFVPPDAVAVPDSIVGRVAAVPIKKGQIILENNLYALGPDTGISLLIATSKRAVTIPVDEMRAVAKLIRPGDRVDILAAVDAGKGASSKREVKTILTDVSVLATGVNIVNNIPRVFELDSTGKNMSQIALAGDTKYTTITVEVDIKQAQDLVYMLSTAPSNLFFTLRNPNDRSPIPRMMSSTAETVLGTPLPMSPTYTPPVPQAPAALQQQPPTPASPPAPTSRPKPGSKNWKAL